MDSRFKMTFTVLLLTLAINVFGASAFDCPTMVENIMRGHLLKSSRAFIDEKADFTKELHGLNFVEVIPWEPNQKDKALRKLIRKHGLSTLLSKNIPEFDHAQKVGPAKVHINELHFSQYAASNHTGEYTVVGNAQAFKAGKLDPSKFPRLQVWRDTSGKIWTLDHRRLISMVMAGYDKELDVEFVPYDFFKEDRFKFTNMGDGNSIVLSLTKEDGSSKAPIAVVVSKPTVEIKKPKTKRKINFPLEKDPATKKWELARGEDYLIRLEKYSSTLSEEYVLANKRTSEEARELFKDVAEIRSRAKSADSVLAKLIKKDQILFEKGSSIADLNMARSLIGDGIGLRAFFKANAEGVIDQKAVQLFVMRLAKSIEDGKIRITEILNYRPKDHNNLAYFTDEQVRLIVEADARFALKQKAKGITHKPVIVKNGPGAYLDMGYTSFHFNFSNVEEVLGEVQVRGRLVHEMTETMHLFYDLKMGKPVSSDLLKDPEIAKAVKAFTNLSAKQKDFYYGYIQAIIIHFRQKELAGIKRSTPPKLPDGFPEELNLITLKDHVLSIVP